MKYSLSLCVVLLSWLSSNSNAATVRDTVYADSIYYGEEIGAYHVTNPSAALDTADDVYASFSIGSLLDLAFKTKAGTEIRPIHKNAVIWVWGKKDLSVDTSAGQLVLFKADAFGALLYQSDPVVLNEGLNMIVVDSEYSYVEFTLTGTEINPGSKGYLLDAMMLIQDEEVGSVPREYDQESTILACYPNPFPSAQHTTLVVHLANSAEVTVKIYDALGRAVTGLSLGTLEPGRTEVPVSVPKAQAYFIQLFVNGAPSGSPLKLTAL